MATANSLNNAEIPDALIDAKGDIIVGNADNTPQRLAVGTDGYVLTADSGAGAGVKWGTVAAAHAAANGATPQIANLVFGSGDPPDAATVPEGTIWIKHSA